MKALLSDQVADFFADLQSIYNVRVPVLLPDGTRSFGCFGAAPLALLGGALPEKPTSAFFPHSDIFFTAGSNSIQVQAPLSKPLLIAGFTPSDLKSLRFTDRFFDDGLRDDIYFRLRKNAVIVAVSGYCLPDGALIPPAGGGCDLELVFDGSIWFIMSYSETGSKITAELPDNVPEEIVGPLPQETCFILNEDEELIKKAASILRNDLVPDSFWEEIGDKCILCTSCNLVCPTCTCFGVQDWRYGEAVERSRMWDSCQLSGFMREASGHNPLGTEALRTRRRIHHKLAADPLQWGEISCFLCGRCDAACPTGIGILAVAREMVHRFG